MMINIAKLNFWGCLKMHIGISTYAYTWAIGVPGYPLPDAPLTAFALLDRAHALGVDVVQFADNLPLDRLNTAELDELISRARTLNLALEIGTRGIAYEHLMHYLALAQAVASPLVRIVIDTADLHPDPPDIVAALRRVMPDYERAGVRLAIENHDRFRARELRSMIEHIGSDHVGVCLDTVNSFGALEGPDVVLDALAAHVINVHVKDFQVRRMSHNMGFIVEGTPAGDGMLDLPWLMDQLRSHGRDPNLILELWTPPELAINDTIAKESAWAERSVHYLHSVVPSARIATT